VLLAITLAGCAANSTNGNNSENLTSGENLAASETTQTPQTPEPAQVLPIDEYLNLLWGTDLSPEAQILDRQAENVRVEELIAECMHAAGFDYTPFPEGTQFVIEEGVEWLTDDPEWLAEYGFGVLNWPGSPGRGVHSFGGDIPGVVNPNREFELSLTGAEQEAYQRTLWGIPFPFPESTEEILLIDDDEVIEWTEDPANWGCQRTAWEQMTTEMMPYGLRTTDQFAPLFAAIEQFRTNFALELTDANRDWAACMVAAGYSEFSVRPADFNLYFSEELTEVTTQLQRDGVMFTNWPPAPGEHPALDEFRRREIDTALADLQCRQATDYDARQADAIVAAETQFVTDHRADFEALRSAIEQFG